MDVTWLPISIYRENVTLFVIHLKFHLENILPTHTRTHTPNFWKGEAEAIVFLNIEKDLGFGHESHFAKIKHQAPRCTSTSLSVSQATSFASIHLIPPLLLSVSTECTRCFGDNPGKSKYRRIPILTELSKLCFKDRIQGRSLCICI